jgi:fatty-acyl-CoA synthase
LIATLLSGLSRTDAGIEFHGPRGMEILNFAELAARMRAQAGHLMLAGVASGEPVVIALHADANCVVAFLALLWLGAVPVSIKTPRASSPAYGAYVDRICERFGIRHVLESCADPPRNAFPALRTRSLPASAARFGSQPGLAFVQFSSGSIQEPKAIPITEAALIANVREILHQDARRADTVVLSFLPLSHDMGLVGGLLSCLWLQNPLILVETGTFLMRPLRTLERACARGASITMLPEFAMRHLTRVVRRQRDAGGRLPCFEAFHTIYCGSEPIRHETVSAFVQAGEALGLHRAALVFCYGLAEATLMVTGHRLADLESSFDDSRTSSPVARLGKPVDGVELAVDSQDGTPGAVLLRGDSVFEGYWQESPRKRGEWFDTGDIGYLVAGELHVCGRHTDRISVNGAVIFATDLEAEISASGLVQDCLVLPEENGFALLIVPGSEGQDVLPIIHAKLAREFGVVARAVAVGVPRDIVRTTSGKPRRDATREALGGRLPAQAMSAQETLH